MNNKDNKMTALDITEDEKDMTVWDSRSLFYLATFIISIGFILMIPVEAKPIATNKGWFLQPYISPLLGLSVIAVFSAIVVGRKFLFINAFRPLRAIEYVSNLVADNSVAIITSLLFCIYIYSVNKIGFFLSTYLFVCTLLFLSRLLNRFWLIVALLTTILVILIFRVGIGLWLDDVWLYEFLPSQLADFANRYL